MTDNQVFFDCELKQYVKIIVIENIKCAWPAYNATPCCVFYGAELKRDGTPKKNGAKRYAYQSNENKENK